MHRHVDCRLEYLLFIIAMSGFSELVLIDKLSKMSNSQQSIQSKLSWSYILKIISSVSLDNLPSKALCTECANLGQRTLQGYEWQGKYL